MQDGVNMKVELFPCIKEDKITLKLNSDTRKP